VLAVAGQDSLVLLPQLLQLGLTPGGYLLKLQMHLETGK